MKSFLILSVLIFYNSLIVFSQEYCIVDEETLPDEAYFFDCSNLNFDDNDLIRMRDVVDKVVRINFHFIQKDDGSGNFGIDWDGIDSSNNYNAFLYIEDLMNVVN